ncbi:helix-turn-helix domain-containing protein [Lactococcus lactis]|jgi:transcriptional regulator with XRE-family HTH domain|uniref:Helix-turn-helix domain-containing protein n=1 Tax=Lactococcus lactis TaxID=1358 RepID=A0AB35KC44_9LACT|nr:helix-turn-helix transcriptional regulator [Lactococcus lactis]KST96264.1 transcriptional regulator Cro/CI family [Lactococcus lactis subsp. lactis]MDG4979082.1 helix-turn-helix domain-containing protein [Lactococcus lactis]MDG5048967.1 helix-turn-helix domain-containing protein [Lactococcus lactis]WNN68472.1 helix-turn-helix transcriptional regulator [Lactococcus lactis]WPK08781.1 helix-turn-helix transcriptional regulator [Lactococcus lactis]
MSVFAEQLKTLRKKNSLTQKELAEKVGVKQNSYANWENGNREPNIEMLVRIADYFDVSLDYLLGGKMKNITEEFSLCLKKLRMKRKLSQKQIAEELKISQQQYSKWEGGIITPNAETLVRLADYFDVSVDYLLGRKIERN